MTDKKLIVYSTEWCSKCRSLKNFLKSKNIEYEEREPDESVTELPTVEYDTHRLSGDFSFRELLDMLKE